MIAEKLTEQDLHNKFKKEKNNINPHVWQIVEGLSGTHYLIVGMDEKLGFEVENLDDFTGKTPKDGLFIQRFRAVAGDNVMNRYQTRIEKIRERRSSKDERK